MFSKNKQGTTSRNNESSKVDIQVEMEIKTGYFTKSPAQTSVIKNTKSWKRRFFVLTKRNEDSYQLAYYENNERKEKPLGVIDLSKITLMFTSPEKLQLCDWIQKNFKCSPSSVLFIRVEDLEQKQARDYFLVGTSSKEVDSWFKALLKIVKPQNKQQETEDSHHKDSSTSADNIITQESEDVCNGHQSQTDSHDDERSSEQECRLTSSPTNGDHYDIPRKYSLPQSSDLNSQVNKTLLSEDKDEDDDEPPVDSSEYLDMSSVIKGLQQTQEEEDNTCLQTNETHTAVQKDISINQNDLKNSLVFREESGKLCVSECKQTEASCQFQKGDQIVAFNDLLIDTVEEIHTYLKRLSKNEVKLTILRHHTAPLRSERFPSH